MSSTVVHQSWEHPRGMEHNIVPPLEESFHWPSITVLAVIARFSKQGIKLLGTPNVPVCSIVFLDGCFNLPIFILQSSCNKGRSHLAWSSVIVLVVVCYIACSVRTTIVRDRAICGEMPRLFAVRAMVSALVCLPNIQLLKKPSQCFAILERLTWHKSNKLCNIVKIIYVIV